jgi:hypothetical protein
MDIYISSFMDSCSIICYSALVNYMSLFAQDVNLGTNEKRRG